MSICHSSSGEGLGVVDIRGGFVDAALGLLVAITGIEAHTVQVVDSAVVATLERLNFRDETVEVVEVIGGGRCGGRLLAGPGQDEGVCGALGGAPSLLRRIANIAVLKALDGLRMDVASVGEEFVNAVLDCGGGNLCAPVALWAYLTSAG